MYTAIKIIGVRKGANKRWEPIALTQYTLAQMGNLFRRVQFTLHAPEETTDLYLNYEALTPAQKAYSGNILQFLASIAGLTLPTISQGIVLRQSWARFMDAYAAGYDIKPVDNMNRDDVTILDNNKPHLRLFRRGNTIDYTYAQSHMLVSVNGIYHRTDTDGVNGLIVYNGATSIKSSRQTEVGLLSFSSVAAISPEPISDAKINIVDPSKPIITLTTPLTNKSVFLIFAGYMVFVDGSVLSRVGDQSYRLDMTKLNLVERYYELKKYIDLSPLALPTSPTDGAQVSVADLTSDQIVRNWLKLSQSFFVIVDCPEIYTQTNYLSKSGIPNAYFSPVEPNQPLVLELGRQPSYWTIHEDGVWRINIYDNIIDNELYYTNPIPRWVNVNGSNVSGNPTHISQAYFLEIGRDI